MKKLLIILLALVMCLSVFVSCNDDKDKDDEKKKDPSKEMETVTDAIGKVNLKDLINSTIDEIFAEGTQSEFNKLLDEFKKLNGEVNVSATVEGEKTNVYFGIKDEIIKIVDPEGKAGFAFLSGNQFILLSPDNSGYELEISDDIPFAIPDLSESVDLDQYKQMVDMYLTDEVIAALEGIKLDVTKADLVEKDGFYILTNDAIVRIANEVFDAYIDVMKAFDAPASALPPVDETKAQIKTIVEALNLQIGFSVKNDKVVGIKFATEFDPDALGFLGTSGKVEEEVMPASDESSKVAISFVAMSNDDATLLDTVDVAYSFDEDGDKQTYAFNAKFLYNDKLNLCGADVSFTVEMSDTYLGYYYDNTAENSKDIDVYGYQKATGNVKLDLSKLSSIGATVAEMNVSMNSTAKKYTTYVWNEVTGEGSNTEITDSALINKIEASGCYAKTFSINANAKVEKTGVLAFSLEQKENSATQTKVSGTFAWTAAPNYGTIPSDVREKFIDNSELSATLDRLFIEAAILGDEVYPANPNDWNAYTWYDAESGLWVYFDRYECVYFYTYQPSNAIVINK